MNNKKTEIEKCMSEIAKLRSVIKSKNDKYLAEIGELTRQLDAAVTRIDLIKGMD